MKVPAFAPAIAACLVLMACSPDSTAPPESVAPVAPAPSAGTIVNDAALANENDRENWLAFGRTYSEQRYSPLDQINDSNVSEIGVEWYKPLPNARGLTSTPLVVDGVIYFVASMNRIYAVDATSGEELWMWDPRINEHSDMRIGWEHNRGIGIWEDKVYQATWDGRLIAVSRETGQEIWTQRIFPEGAPLYNTGAPKIFKGKVMVGSGGTEAGPNRGYVTAWDAETGEEAWRFYIVPGNPADGFENAAMEMAAETWTGEWWQFGGGGNAWHGFTYDPELDVLYVGTGNGAPWNRKIRSPGGGDNLFLDSVVALNPDTGEYIWHYQNTPGETWDYNSNMDIILADLEIDGRTVKAMMQAPKNGFFYVHDRENHSLISAEPYTEVTWASHVDLETGRPVERPGVRYEDGSERIRPGPLGGHSWHAMSYNPDTGLVYIPANNQAADYSDAGIEHATWQPTAYYDGDGMGVAAMLDDRRTLVHGSLQARDPVTNTVAWEIPMFGVGNAGTMTTAGNLVFQGRVDGTFHAYNASTGESLWSADLGLGITAPPVTYAVDGKQYIALLIGWGGAPAGAGGDVAVSLGWAYGVHERRLVVFSLDGNMQLPEQPQPTEAQPIPLPTFEVIDEQLANEGAGEFLRCLWCHGGGAVSPGMAPDLRASPLLASAEAFAEVVREGSLMQNGMPMFGHLDDDTLLKIRHFVRREAEAALAESQ